MSDNPSSSSSSNQAGSPPTQLLEFPAELVIRHRTGGRTLAWQVLAVTGWLGVLILFGFLQYHWYIARDFYDDSHGITEVHFSGDSTATRKIAIIKVTGVIYDGHGFVKRQIDRVSEDENIVAVVLRVDSPGGTVSGSDYIYHYLKQMLERREIPVVVSMGSVAASGGYYVSMVVGDQPDSILAEPTCTTGSIGVIIPHWNYSELMETYGVVDDSIMSHPRKRMLSPSRKMTEDHRRLLQEYVDESFYGFKRKVLEGRPAFRKGNEKALQGDGSAIKIEHEGRDVATGEIFHAPKALRYGLIDRLGFIEDAIDRAAELANVKADQCNVIEYYRPAPFIEIPFLNRAEASSTMLDVLLEMNSPRAYYLSTNLPPLVSSQQSAYRRSAEQPPAQ